MRKYVCAWTVCCLIGAINTPAAGETNSMPKLEEVLRIIKGNLAGTTDDDLNRAAVRGLLSQLSGQVALVEPGGEAVSAPSASGLLQTNIFDEVCGYMRVGAVGNGLAEKVKTAFKGLQAGTAIKGLVLDLRFASGLDYAAAAQTADLFLSQEKTILSWNDQTAKSTHKADAINVPLVALVNAETRGAAEALAALVQHEGIGLIIGVATAGQATVFKDFKLENGQLLRVAATQIRLGNGQTMPLHGLTPDIEISIDVNDEKDYLENAFLVATNKPLAAIKEKTAAGTVAKRPARHRVNEAELVRAQKEGINPEEDTPAAVPKESLPPRLFVRDPALARALDLLKGMIVVRRTGRS